MQDFLKQLNIDSYNPAYSTGLNWGSTLSDQQKEISSPVDNKLIASVQWATTEEYNHVVQTAEAAFIQWRQIPAPKRGEIVRQIGEELRKLKIALGRLVSYEMGKIYQEGLGEVQEMIDICDFAVGLSRQLYGLTMHSERPLHRMYEQYHPLGIVGIISAFNFPVAVWSWNAMLAAVCGNVCIWKPSEKTPLTAIACQHIISNVLKNNNVPEGVFNLVLGDASIGHSLASDKRVPLISATGSTRMGRKVGETVANRLGKSLLELGGNNAIIITPNADLEMAIRAVTFGAVGTCGQRCTSTRRLILHESIYQTVADRLVSIYAKLPIGNPLEDGVLVGPLIDKQAVKNFTQALDEVKKSGGKILAGGEVLSGEKYSTGTYVTPALVEAQNDYPIVQQETFGPILYLIQYKGNLENAIAIHNDVQQGLSSAIFSLDLREVETFLSYAGSDCGIANANIGTSGAEIGGAFGGEKETGGGRESGSDAWRAYMRRQTNTINYSKELPLAQGITFDI
ncbi:aldehyde dehydrogenase family protein [Cytophagaceae bacterium DM2B3-1]|uniref:aldehyde dehydrogenase (NAD(+)) n=1 Tax=Xanthocytophaga flava TaxID=3048013 RepID=A0ABT7CG82_9BACT|nr:aldehyde dehydrogenase family protein [Xanthocytophaga flavus]MDJ1492005.1 aldehyde dehydrogenase family protein [Xanthocytophaga flavus]